MESKISQYKDYSVQDYLWDEPFVAWCKSRPEANHDFWLQVLETYPEQERNIATARSFLLQVTVKDQLPAAEQLQDVWQRIESELPQARPAGFIRKLRWMQIAAVVLLTVGVGVLAYYTSSTEEKISTQYAEIKKLQLPDHSTITLNAHSVIRYDKKWDTSKPREVWLTGEAYFEIAHLHKGTAPVKPGERFIVHANGVDVEVLGTSFSINNRHEAAQIILTSGSIELKFTDKKINNILMKPGEMVKYTKASQKIEKQTAGPLTTSAWKEHRLEFDQTSLKEVLQLLKDDYGLEATVEDPELWNKTISGTISSDSTDLVIKGLSVLLDINIEQKNQTLILKH